MKTSKLIISLLFLLTLTLSCVKISAKVDNHSNQIPNRETMNNPFIHHVYFYLKNPNSAEDREQLLEGLEKLSKVSTIQQHYVGFPATTNRDVIEKGYDISWLCIFKNISDQELYQQDPIHLKFIEEYGHLWDKVMVYDSVK